MLPTRKRLLDENGVIHFQRWIVRRTYDSDRGVEIRPGDDSISAPGPYNPCFCSTVQGLISVKIIGEIFSDWWSPMRLSLQNGVSIPGSVAVKWIVQG